MTMEPAATTLSTPPPPAPKQKTTLGSLVVAMLFGAILAVALLYMWGAEIAKEEAAAGQAQ